MDYNRFAFEVNYFGPLAVTKAFLPLLRQNKGRIVNVSRCDVNDDNYFSSSYTSRRRLTTNLIESSPLLPPPPKIPQHVWHRLPAAGRYLFLHKIRPRGPERHAAHGAWLPRRT
jgi:hypothetical protein